MCRSSHAVHRKGFPVTSSGKKSNHGNFIHFTKNHNCMNELPSSVIRFSFHEPTKFMTQSHHDVVDLTSDPDVFEKICSAPCIERKRKLPHNSFSDGKKLKVESSIGVLGSNPLKKTPSIDDFVRQNNSELHHRAQQWQYYNSQTSSPTENMIKSPAPFSLSEMVALSRQSNSRKPHIKRAQSYARSSMTRYRKGYQYGSYMSIQDNLVQNSESNGSSLPMVMSSNSVLLFHHSTSNESSHPTSSYSTMSKQGQIPFSLSASISSRNPKYLLSNYLKKRQQSDATNIQERIESIKIRYQKQQGKVDNLFRKCFQDCHGDCIPSKHTVEPSCDIPQVEETELSSSCSESDLKLNHPEDTTSVVSIESGDMKTDDCRHVHFNDEGLHTVIPTTTDTFHIHSSDRIQNSQNTDDNNDLKSVSWYSREDYIRFRNDCQLIISKHYTAQHQIQEEQEKLNRHTQCPCQQSQKLVESIKASANVNMDCARKQKATYVRLSHHLTIIDPNSYDGENECVNEFIDTTGLERYLLLPSHLSFVLKSRRKECIEWILTKQEENRNRIHSFQTNLSLDEKCSDFDDSLSEIAKVFSIPSAKRAFRTAMLLHKELLLNS